MGLLPYGLDKRSLVKLSQTLAGGLTASLVLLLSTLANADPCGMVPPISIAPGQIGIQRTGIQRTYVMFRDGVETIALRPGFQGSVEDFGMLIPFPSPPAIRKIEDETFSHIEGAVQPPRVFVQRYLPRPSSRMSMKSMAVSADSAEAPLALNEVAVLSQEAVGMYQVAVLEAGSAKALKGWMDDNGYRFPDGMDAVTNEYIGERWCFVAIKARVGAADGVTPRPGMRTADSSRPNGSEFDGHVQGMGFRFKTDEPVVPMRLSVFNGADPHNVVYMLSDQAVRMTGVSTALVDRQISGEQLHKHVTEQLPLHPDSNISLATLRGNELQRLNEMRDPTPYVRIAREIFSADLLALRQQTLSLPFEEQEKQLLNVSEAFGMRGVEVDQLHNQVIGEARDIAVQGALDDLREMTLTVFDGTIPSDHLAAENITFDTWRKPKGANIRRDDPLTPSDLTFYANY